MIRTLLEMVAAVAAEIILTAEITAGPWGLEHLVREQTVVLATQMERHMVSEVVVVAQVPLEPAQIAARLPVAQEELEPQTLLPGHR
jgi:hypothetical protein